MNYESEENHVESLLALESVLKIKDILNEIENKKNEILNLCNFIATERDKKNINYAFSDFNNYMSDTLDDISHKHEQIIEDYENDINSKWEQSLRSDYYKSVL